MKQTNFSPYQMQHQQNTAYQETQSYKKYPINKYYSSKNPSEIKNQLFTDKYQNLEGKERLLFGKQQLQSSINYLRAKQQDKGVYGNQKIRNLLKRNHQNALNCVSFDLKEKGKRYGDSQSQYPMNLSYNNRPQTSRDISYNNKKHAHKKRIQSTKSCNSTQLKKKKKSLTIQRQFQQTQEQLSMYKKLCITLRKQNDDLQQKVNKQNKKSQKFTSEIENLKDKIRKMYDYCIEKNKSRKNVDAKFNILFENYNLNKNNSGNMKDLHPISQTVTIKNVNKRTIDSQKTTKRGKENGIQSINTSKYLKKDSDRKHVLSCRINNKKAINSQRTNKPIKQLQEFSLFLNKINHKNVNQTSARNIQYDDSKQNLSSSESPNRILNSIRKQIQITDQQYKQFFNTFIKSLQIFQDPSQNSTNKNKLLRQNGLNIQWAKQQWLEIVQFLIKKGYISGSSKNKNKVKTKQNLFTGITVNTIYKDFNPTKNSFLR